MADLTRIQSSQPVQLVDANDFQVCDISTVAPTGTESGLIVRNIPAGTQTVGGTITASPTGTYTVAGTTTNVPSGTQTVAGTITASPTGTYTVAGTVTAVPTGTQIVAGTVTASPTGTYTVAGTVTNVPSGTQTIAGTVTASPTGTYTVSIANTGSSTTATVALVTVSNASSTSLLASNSNRKMATFFVDGVNPILLKFGATASATSYTVRIGPFGLFELPIPLYCGAIEALAINGSSTVLVTEV